jgi:hypothetical protein
MIVDDREGYDGPEYLKDSNSALPLIFLLMTNELHLGE